jgi:hypothetical protein
MNDMHLLPELVLYGLKSSQEANPSWSQHHQSQYTKAADLLHTSITHVNIFLEKNVVKLNKSVAN